jgi:hypothetical protein
MKTKNLLPVVVSICLSLLLVIMLQSNALSQVPIACVSDLDCNDFFPCTDDLCVEGTCSNLPVPYGTPCDDGIFCNGLEICDGFGMCSILTPPCEGESGNICLETERRCVECITDADCPDLDGNPCTRPACIENVCTSVNREIGESCDDGLFCNGADTCNGEGTCSVHAGNPCPPNYDCIESPEPQCVPQCNQPVPEVCNDGIDNDCDGLIDAADPDCQIKVSIDIKPGSCPNPITLKTIGVISVAIMGAKDFNIKQIDPASIRLTREGVGVEVAPLRWSYSDAGAPNEDFDPTSCNCGVFKRDRNMDLVLKFNVQEVVNYLKLADVVDQTRPLTITGNLKDEFGGAPIRGEDCIKVSK